MLYPQQNQYRDISILDGIWKFKLDLENIGLKNNWHNGINNSRPIVVPSSWNELYPDTTDYIGVGWYESDFFVPSSWTSNNTILRFSSVTYKATVWINGNLIGTHEGGHLPFEFKLDTFGNDNKSNKLVIRVENELKPDRVPPGNVESGSLSIFMDNTPSTNYDFFPYAGIDRSVYLYHLPEFHLTDVTVNTSLIDDSGLIDIIVKSNNDDTNCYALISSDTDSVKSSSISLKKQNKISLKINNPQLWSCSDPFLYQLNIFITKNGEILDSYELEIGIRTIEIKGHKVLLNGEPIELKGFGRHEDSFITGRGQNLPQTIKDHNLLKWIGANSYRTAHYPYSEEDLFLADKHGFLVVDEIPAVGLFFDGNGKDVETRLDICRKQISELINRDKNHPSVIMWSIANEPFPPDLLNRMQSKETSGDSFNILSEPVDPSATKFMNTLLTDAKKLDNTRPVTFAAIHGTPIEWLDNVDVIMLNRYYGWYFDGLKLDEAIQKLSIELDYIYGKTKKPIIISEFGADTITGSHSVSQELYTEEYQLEFWKSYLDLADQKDFLIGLHAWVFADFRTTHSLKRIGGLNQKGAFTRDRKPKMSAHFLKKRWD